MKMKIKKVDIPIYFGKLLIIQTNKWKHINRKFDLDIRRDYEAVVFKDNKNRHVVCFCGEISFAIIAHETVHLVNNIFLDCNMKLDPDNDENQAYLTGWIVKTICKALKI